ncbi:MAG TPA: DUF3987 domain-containing protein [Sedimentisphaerales bacterium]|nr:DUF3987 domain-containing protein [Sedimentisphaerales bacterium]
MSESDNSSITNLEAQMAPLYGEYKQLVTPSEVSEEFHLFVFMTMISALVGDKLFFREGNDVIYPHLWTMLLGSSGTGRKTTAFSPAVKVLAKTGKVNLLAPKGSAEGFFKELVEHEGVGLLRHSELGSLLGALKKDYMGGFADELCEIYDPASASLVKRLSQETLSVDHFAVSWIAATTPDSLNRYDAYERIAGGFLPRWNIVFGGPPNTFIHFRKAKYPDYFNKFVGKLIKPYPTESYEAKFSDDAMKVHKEWYDYYRPRIQDGRVGAFEIRILEVVKKYAVLLAFLNDRKEVSKDDMMLALKFGDYFFSTATRLITTEIAENKNELLLQKILRAIRRLKKKGKPTLRRNIMRSTSLLVRDFEIGTKTLEARGDVVHNTKDDTWDLGEESTDETLTKD